MTDKSELREFYETITSKSPGVSMMYRGFKLKKIDVGGISPPDHSEIMIINRDDTHVETYSLSAFSDFTSFKQRLNDLIEQEPDGLPSSQD